MYAHFKVGIVYKIFYMYLWTSVLYFISLKSVQGHNDSLKVGDIFKLFMYYASVNG